MAKSKTTAKRVPANKRGRPTKDSVKFHNDGRNVVQVKTTAGREYKKAICVAATGTIAHELAYRLTKSHKPIS